MGRSVSPPCTDAPLSGQRDRTLLFLLLAGLSACLLVCASTKKLHYLAADFESFHDRPITSVTMNDGRIVTFGNAGGRYSEGWGGSKVSRHVVGIDDHGKEVDVDLSKALEVEVMLKSGSVAGTILAVLGVTLVTGVVFLLVYFTLNPIRS
jgi:hypothetical protein